MSEPFLAEIRIVGFNFAPRNYAFCDGQLLPISQNQSLFSLLGTTFGGDGRISFALPELRGRVPTHFGQGPGLTNRNLGQKEGEQSVALNLNQVPQHSHNVQASSVDGNNPAPGGNILARSLNELYRQPTPSPTTIAMRADSITNAGSSQGHNNMQPYLTINFIIALQGLFPSRN